MAENNKDRLAKERAARAKRAANATKPDRSLPVTEASQTLAAAFEHAGHPELAAKARALQWDENYSRAALPISELIAVAMLHRLSDIADRATAGDFDSTQADNDAYYATPRGRNETAQYRDLIDKIPRQTLHHFDQAMRRLSEDPQAQQRLTKKGTADIAERIGLTEPAPDDDDIVTTDQVEAHLHQLLGVTHANGTRLDTPEILAAAEAVGRAGADSFAIDYDEPTHLWQAIADFPTVRGPLRITSDELPGVNAAARDMVHKVLAGAQCSNCGAVITFDPRGYHAKTKTLIDGRAWTLEQQKKAGSCLWRRRGPHWNPDCKQQPA